uniref:Uncharacterized protein n=1 Tax=Chenopodium quinoa TaxID=63459 RepID=A0A803MSD0_CHEQI
MLVSCNEAKLMWYLSPLRLEVENFEGNNFVEWCGKVRVTFKDHCWWNIFWSLVWGIWLRRNAWVYDGKKKDMADVIYKAISTVGEFENAKEQECKNANAEVLECRWKAAPPGFVKIEGKFVVDVAEAMALRHSLVITMESGFLKVCLETDNLKWREVDGETVILVALDFRVVELVGMMRRGLTGGGISVKGVNGWLKWWWWND